MFKNEGKVYKILDNFNGGLILDEMIQKLGSLGEDEEYEESGQPIEVSIEDFFTMGKKEVITTEYESKIQLNFQGLRHIKGDYSYAESD